MLYVSIQNCIPVQAVTIPRTLDQPSVAYSTFVLFSFTNTFTTCTTCADKQCHVGTPVRVRHKFNWIQQTNYLHGVYIPDKVLLVPCCSRGSSGTIDSHVFHLLFHISDLSSPATVAKLWTGMKHTKRMLQS